jgi:hypothetical protein
MLTMTDKEQQHQAAINILHKYWQTKDLPPNALEREILSMLKDPRKGHTNAISILNIIKESIQDIPPESKPAVPLKDLTDRYIPKTELLPKELMIVQFEKDLCCHQELTNPDEIVIYLRDKVFSTRGHVIGVKTPTSNIVVFQVARSGYATKHDLRSWDELWALNVETFEFRRILDITWDLGYMQRGSDYALYSPSRSDLGVSFDPIDAYYREDYPIPKCETPVMQTSQVEHRSPYFIHKRYIFNPRRKEYRLTSTTIVDKSRFLVLASQLCGESGRFPSGDSQEVAYRDFLWLDQDPMATMLGAFSQLSGQSQQLLERLVRAAVPDIPENQFNAQFINSRKKEFNRKIRNYYTQRWCKFNVEGR